jgi:hypothetical protein
MSIRHVPNACIAEILSLITQLRAPPAPQCAGAGTDATGDGRGLLDTGKSALLQVSPPPLTAPDFQAPPARRDLLLAKTAEGAILASNHRGSEGCALERTFTQISITIQVQSARA